mmetsp:Transcript_19455/g.35239  ORF Transcript_19455/g.35239 Transcript_19455/m.35239 type:complete len:159 (-) Transcript_19455:1385-1861(-)
MQVAGVELVDSTIPPILVIIPVDTYPTYIFEKLDVDFQIDAFYDEAEDRIRESCDEYYKARDERVERRSLLKKNFPFNIVERNGTFQRTDVNVALDFQVRAKLTAYFKVPVKINGMGFEAELGAGYDYLFGAGASAEAQVALKQKGGNDVWTGKKTIQ